MALSYGSGIFAGQRFFAPTSDAFNPVAVGPVQSTVPAPIPAVAPGYSSPAIANSSSSGSSSPFSLTQAPTIAVIAALAIGLVWLHVVHFRGE